MGAGGGFEALSALNAMMRHTLTPHTHKWQRILIYLFCVFLRQHKDVFIIF